MMNGNTNDNVLIVSSRNNGDDGANLDEGYQHGKPCVGMCCLCTMEDITEEDGNYGEGKVVDYIQIFIRIQRPFDLANLSLHPLIRRHSRSFYLRSTLSSIYSHNQKLNINATRH